MQQPTLEELDRAADEILSKAEKSDKLDPEEIADGIDEEEAEEIDGDAEDEELDETDDDEEGEEEDDEDDADDVQKALMNEAFDDDVATETMSAVVEIIAKSLADVMDNVSDTREYNENSSSVLAKSLLAQNVILQDQKASLEKTNRRLSGLNKSLTDRLDSIEDMFAAIEEKLDSFASQPAHMRKSVASYSVTDRNFKGSLEGTTTVDGSPEPLSKSEIIGILNNELMNGSQIVSPDDIVAIESGCPMRGEIQALIKSKCAR